MMNKKMLAEKLMVSISTVDRLLAAGMPRIKAGKQVRFVYEEVEKWLKERGGEKSDG